MVMAEKAKREKARRTLEGFVLYNFHDFKLNWHHKKLFDALERVERGELKRLMIFMPPRHSKSEIGSIQFPAWAVGKDHDKNIVVSSYSGDLATDFGRQTRNLIKDKKYHNIFPGTSLAPDSESKSKWNTNGRGAYTAVGVGGSLTGKGADILIIDDPVKDRKNANSITVRDSTWDWFKSTARTRLSPGGAIILIMTRWHDDDLAGRILDNENEKEVNLHDWEILKFPAIAEEDEEFRKKGEALWADHFTLEILKETKGDLGGYEWSALYQQNPIDEENQIFKKDWFKYKDITELEHVETRNFITIDTRGSDSIDKGTDYIGITRNFVNSDNHWHLISTREKLSGVDFVDRIFTLYEKDKPEKIGIEKTAYTEGLKPFLEAEMLKRNIILPIVELSHKQTMKELRIQGISPRYERGWIYHLKTGNVNLCVDLEEELLRFPNAKNDDASDSAAYQDDIAEPAFGSEDTDEEAGFDIYADESYMDRA